MNKMLMGFALGLIAVLSAQPAFAFGDLNVDNRSTATGGSVGPISNTTGPSTAITGPSISDAKASAKSGAASDATSVQGQQQKQGNDQNISSTVTVPGQAPAIFAPNLTSSPEACMGSVSAGGGAGFGGTSFGITFGTTWTNEQCQDRMNARTLGSLGQNQAALEYLAATNPKIADALKRAGVKLASVEAPVVAQAPTPTAAQGGVVEKHTAAALPAGITALGPVCADGRPSVIRAGSRLYSCYGYDRDGLAKAN